MNQEEYHTDLNQREIIEALHDKLEALLSALDNSDDRWEFTPVYQAARAALDKAEGK